MTVSAAPFGVAESQSFARDGFVLWQRFLTPRALSRLRREVDSALEKKHPEIDAEWIQNIHQHPAGAWMWELASSDGVAQAARAVCGGPVVLYGSQIAVRVPRMKWESSQLERGLDTTPWHQDGHGARIATFWLPLDHVDKRTGGLEVMKHGHREGKFPLRRLQNPCELPLARKMAVHNVFEIDVGGDRTALQCQIHSYRLRAGGAGVHHPSLPHRSGPNLSTKPRRVIILRYMHTEELSSNDKGVLRHWQTNEWFEREYRVVP